MTLATSIAPYNLKSQQQAVASWLALGFSVISVNAAEEIVALEAEFPAVRFVAVARDARGRHGKPLVYINDVLDILGGCGTPICGIINSDILLRVGDNQAFVDFVRREASGAMLFGSRINVASGDEVAGDEHRSGFDYFFFDRALIPLYHPGDFCFGIPWWDYWFPLVPFLSGIPTRRLVSPVAFHPLHEDRWSKPAWKEFGAACFAYVCRNHGSSVLANDLREQLRVSAKVNLVWACLYCEIPSVFFNEVHRDIDMVRISRSQYFAMQDALGTVTVKHAKRQSRLIRSLGRLVNRLLRHM